MDTHTYVEDSKRPVELITLDFKDVLRFNTITGAARFLGVSPTGLSSTVARKVKTKPYPTSKHRVTLRRYYVRYSDNAPLKKEPNQK